MVRLHFDSASLGHSVTLGPAPWFQISGNFIRQGPDATIVATYRRHQWEVQSQHFTRFDCRDRAVIHFEDMGSGASEDFGPFTHFHAADGTIYADDELFAKFMEESQLWHCYPTETFWPVLFFKSAMPRTGSGPIAT